MFGRMKLGEPLLAYCRMFEFLPIVAIALTLLLGLVAEIASANDSGYTGPTLPHTYGDCNGSRRGGRIYNTEWGVNYRQSALDQSASAWGYGGAQGRIVAKAWNTSLTFYSGAWVRHNSQTISVEVTRNGVTKRWDRIDCHSYASTSGW